MPAFRQSIVIRAPVERVFAALTAFEDAPKFVPQVVASRLLTEGPARTGTRFEQLTRFLGARAAVMTEVTELTPNQRLAYRGLTGFRYTAAYDFTAAEGGTRIDYAVRLSLPWYAVPVIPWVMRAARRTYMANMATFGSLLERHGALQPAPP